MLADAGLGANARFTIDLEAQTITRPDGEKVEFDIDAARKHRLLNGLDEIGLTMQMDDQISDFESERGEKHPWV